MFAKDVMTDGGAFLSPEVSVIEAAALLINTRQSALPVVDGQGALVGIVSEADIIPHVMLESDGGKSSPDSHRVADIMTRDVVFVAKDASLRSVIEVMTARHLKLVPVCHQNAVVGTLTRADIVRLIASHGATTAGSPADEALRRNVLAATKGRRWSLAQRFDVVVKNGDIHLWGVVPNETVHGSYCEAAHNVPQVKTVTSHMHVMPHGVRMTHLA